jgi:hypothetical protein
MKGWRWAVCLGIAGLALIATPSLRAEPPPAGSSSAPRGAHSVGRKELRQRVEQLLERHRASPSALPSSLPLPHPSASASAAWLPDLSRRWAELAATREARREKNRAALVRELGARLEDAAVRAELSLHAQRLAELTRLEFLARHARTGEQRAQLLGRIQKLQAKEATRHRLRLAKLAPPAAAAPSASSGVGR